MMPNRKFKVIRGGRYEAPKPSLRMPALPPSEKPPVRVSDPAPAAFAQFLMRKQEQK